MELASSSVSGMVSCWTCPFAHYPGSVDVFDRIEDSKFSKMRHIHRTHAVGDFGTVGSVALDHAGRLMVTSGMKDGAWKVWCLDEGHLISLIAFIHVIGSCVHSFKHPATSHALAAVFSRVVPGFIFASGDQGMVVKIQTYSGVMTEFMGLSSWVRALALNIGEDVVIAGDYETSVMSWNVENETPLWRVNLQMPVNCIMIHADVVFVGVQRSELVALDSRTGSTLQQYAKASKWVYGLACFTSGSRFHFFFIDVQNDGLSRL
jgi:outer membrane protein assembly factor BamB